MIRFEPLHKETWSQLQYLFGEKGACGGCWCMYWRLPYREYEKSKGQKNRDKLYDLINSNLPLGILAFDNDVPVGWCSVSPQTELIRLESSRLFKSFEESKSMWSITCLFIHKDYRNKGFSSSIISAASEYAFENGASAIEAYPILPKTNKLPPAFAWVGFVNSYKKAGFKKVVQASENRQIMRFIK